MQIQIPLRGMWLAGASLSGQKLFSLKSSKAGTNGFWQGRSGLICYSGKESAINDGIQNVRHTARARLWRGSGKDEKPWLKLGCSGGSTPAVWGGSAECFGFPLSSFTQQLHLQSVSGTEQSCSCRIQINLLPGLRGTARAAFSHQPVGLLPAGAGFPEGQPAAELCSWPGSSHSWPVLCIPGASRGLHLSLDHGVWAIRCEELSESEVSMIPRL